MKKRIPFLVCILAIPYLVMAQRGKDGNKIITGSNTIVNEYNMLTADAASGDGNITVANNTLNQNGRFAASLSQGDLLLIIQVQGANMYGSAVLDGNGVTVGSPMDSTWGSILTYQNCGNYEFAEVFGVSGTNTITLKCPLANSYTASGKVQVIRMPRYTGLTINNSASVTCDSWDGSKGGIIAIEVNGASVINGSINATGKGFRGGNTDNQTGFGVNEAASTASSYGAEKGEGIAGYHDDYNFAGGRYCKGAPLNGGGGATNHNAGGGGGANGGTPPAWKAVGNPSLATANWANAWDAEWIGLSNVTSSGGGRGGYSTSTNNQNALSVGPNQVSWGGDSRRTQGGFGGRPLDYNFNRIFLGGGGGAGDGDDGYSGAGGNAGGIIFLKTYGNISGTGNIVSNGDNGVNSAGNAPLNGIAGKDGAGGGGAGGTIMVQTLFPINGVTFEANGGNGGNQILTKGFLAPAITEAQGPGGGGGGGYINTSVAVSATVNGGVNGTTNSPSFSEFPPNGATVGGSGSVDANLLHYDIVINDTAICTGASVTLTATVLGTLPTGVVLTWFDAAFGGNILGTGNTFVTPVLSNNITYYAGFCPSTFSKPVNITVGPGVTISNAGMNQQICQNATQLQANSPSSGTGLWTVITGSGNFVDNTINNTNVTNLSPGINIFEWTISSPGCPSSSSQVTIEVVSAPVANAGLNQQICQNSIQLQADNPNPGAGVWTVVSGSGNIQSNTLYNTMVTNLSAGDNIFEWTVTSPGCPPSSSQVTIQVTIPPVALAGLDQQICSDQTTLNAQAPSSGTGTWTLISGSGLITDNSNNASTVTNLALGANVFEWTVSLAGCPSSTDQVTINVTNAPVANAGLNQQICQDSIQLQADNPNPGAGVWTVVSGSGNIQNNTLYNTMVSNLSAGANIFEWTVTSPGCPPSSSQVTIQVTIPPVALAGPDQQICSDQTTLNAQVPSSGTGTWTLISGSGLITDNSSNVSTVTSLALGANVFEWTVSLAGCPSSTDQVTINVNGTATSVFAGADTSLCGNFYTLNAQAPASGYVGAWTSPFPDLVFNDNTNQNSEVNGLHNGLNMLVWTLTNNLGCPDVSDTVLITAASTPSAAFAGTDKTICSTSMTLNATAPVFGLGTWLINSGTGSLADEHAPNTTISNLTVGTHVLVWTVSNPPCQNNTDTIVITVMPELSLAYAGTDTSICTDAFQLQALPPVNGTGVWTLVSGGGTIVNANDAATQLNNLPPGTNTFQWTVSNGVCPDNTDQVQLIVSQPPSIASAGGDVVTCTQSAEITAAPPLTGTGQWIVTQGAADIINPNAPTTQATILSPQGATFTWQVSNGSCPSSTDDLVITLLNASNAADAGQNVTINLGDSTTLSGSGGHINGWEPPFALSCIDCPNPVASPIETTTYYLSVTDANGCTSIDSVKVTVENSTGWYLPNAFSPDGNYVNDILYFYGTGVKEFVLQVFDRWGEKVFETSDFKQGWDGTFKGKPSLSGVYAYQLTITFKSTKVEQIKGNISLIRSN